MIDHIGLGPRDVRLELDLERDVDLDLERDVDLERDLEYVVAPQSTTNVSLAGIASLE